jgi:hypothetical protein
MSGALTIGSIEQAAAEAGIEPELVRQAAAGLLPVSGGRAMAVLTPVTPPGKPTLFSGAWWAGGPTRIAIERVITGELSEADCAYLIEEVRSEIGNTGISSTLGKTVSWVTQRSGQGVGRDVQLTITMRAGITRIAVREGLGPLLGGIFGGFGGGVGGGGLGPIMGGIAGGLNAPAAAAIAAVLWVFLTMSSARALYHHLVKGKLKQLNALADRLADLARESIAEHALGPGTSVPRLKP